MLVVYLESFTPEQHGLLQSWGSRVKYWPRTWNEQYLENEPMDWWIDFSEDVLLTEWMLRYPEQSRIMRTLFD